MKEVCAIAMTVGAFKTRLMFDKLSGIAPGEAAPADAPSERPAPASGIT